MRLLGGNGTEIKSFTKVTRTKSLQSALELSTFYGIEISLSRVYNST